MASKTEVFREYDALEDRIEASSFAATWDLADWLREHFPNPGKGRPKIVPEYDLRDLTDRRGRSLSWLHKMRSVAETTARDRLPDVSVRAYEQALRNADGDLAKANAALRRKGTRLRDQAGPMASMSELRNELRKRTPDERADLTIDLLKEDDVIDAVAATPKGAGAIGGAQRAAARYEAPRDGPRAEPLPRLPHFMSHFWRAAEEIRIAQEILTQHGLDERELIEPEARETAERLIRQTGEVAAAVLEAAVEQSI
jgi:hypothetical protein